jgi:hypothetical protein
LPPASLRYVFLADFLHGRLENRTPVYISLVVKNLSARMRPNESSSPKVYQVIKPAGAYDLTTFRLSDFWTQSIETGGSNEVWYGGKGTIRRELIERGGSSKLGMEDGG